MSFAKPMATLRHATGMPTGRLALWWLLASEIVIFGGLLALGLAALRRETMKEFPPVHAADAPPAPVPS